MRRVHAGSIALTVLAWAAALILSFPLIWALVTSFKSELEALEFPPHFVSFHWTLSGYSAVLADGEYFRSLVNSCIIAGDRRPSR